MSAAPPPAPAARKSAMTGALLVLCAGLSWSFSGILVRSAPDLDAWQFLAYRSAGLGLAFFILDRINRRGPLWPRFRKLGAPGAFGAVLMAAAFICYVIALKNTTVANTLFIYSCAPLMTGVMGYFVLGETINRGMMAAIVVGLAGLGIMVYGALGGGGLFGNIMAFLPALFFSIYTVIIRMRPDQDFSPAISGFAYIVVVVAVAIMLLTGDTLLPRWQEAAVAFTNGFLTMGLGFYLFQRGAARIPAVSQVLLAQSETLAAPLWVWLLIDERPSFNTLVGGAVILVAVLLMAYYSAQQEAQRAKLVVVSS